MQRSPIYTFRDGTSTGILDVPLEASIQVNDTGDGTGVPKTFQLLSKVGLPVNATIADLLNGPETNYVDLNQVSEIPSELEKITENGRTGWRMLGRDPQSYGDIGHSAIDFSYSANYGVGSSPYGALGDYSTAFGFRTQATETAYAAAAFGVETKAINKAQVVFGTWNKATSLNTLLEVGYGSGTNDRKNAFEVTSTGIVRAPGLTPTLIDASSNDTLVTKEYSNLNLDNKYSVDGGPITGVVDIIGDGSLNYSLISRGPANFQKEAQFDKTITVGPGADQNSQIIFKDTANLNATPKLYWHSFNKDFYFDTDTTLGLRVWHSGNDGLGSGLDADLLGGIPSTDYASIVYVDNTFASKFDKAGGTITGDTYIAADLGVQGLTALNLLDVNSNATFNSDVDIVGDTTINGNIQCTNLSASHVTSNIVFDGNILSNGNIEAGLTTTSTLTINQDTDLKNSIKFNTGINTPRIFWDAAVDNLLVEDAANPGTPFEVWHSGNLTPGSVVHTFDDLADTPSSKGVPGSVVTVASNGVDLEYNTSVGIGAQWGLITGSLGDQLDLGLALDTKFDKAGGAISGAVDIQEDLKIGVITDTVGSGGSVSRINFTETTSPSSIHPSIYYDTAQGEFKLSSTGYTEENIMHTGNIVDYAALAANNTFTGVCSFTEYLIIGLDSQNRGGFETRRNFGTDKPAFYWDDTSAQWVTDSYNNLSGGAFTQGAVVFTENNFNPASKLDKTGGTVTGPITMQGDVVMTNLPTTNPNNPGQLWNNGGVLSIS